MFKYLLPLFFLLLSCVGDEPSYYTVWPEKQKMERGKTYTFSSPTRFNRSIDIPESVTIVVENGAELMFDDSVTVHPGVRFLMSDSSCIKGNGLMLDGTAEKPITIKSVDGKAVFKGVFHEPFFWSLPETYINARFSHVVIEGAVNGLTANIAHGLTMKNCIIRSCVENGLVLKDSAAVEISQCRFENNGKYDIHLTGTNLDKIDSSNVCTKGIYADYPGKIGSMVMPVTTYYINGAIELAGSTKISAGSQFIFSDYYLYDNAYIGGNMEVESTGTLVIAGTEDKKVILKNAPGHRWGGLFAEDHQSITPAIHAEFIVIDSAYTGIGVHKGTLILKNSSITNFGGFALRADSTSVLELSNNTGFDSSNIEIRKTKQ